MDDPAWYVLAVAHLRPIARDEPMGFGWPVAVARGSKCSAGALPSRPVTHSYSTLAFYTGGRARVEQQGEWSVGAGEMLLVPAGEAHRTLEIHHPDFWGLAFCMPCFTADGTSSLLEPFERVRDGGAAVVRIPSARHAFLEGLFRELEELGRAPRGSADTFDAVQRSLLTLVLNEVAQAGSSASSTGARRSVVVDSLRFIERNCLRRLTVADVATAVGRTPTYVTSALTRATGRSAVQWIVAGRMAEARRLLLHSDEIVDIIAERIGYADATHFIRMFRREHGVTPAAWRSRARAADSSETTIDRAGGRPSFSS